MGEREKKAAGSAPEISTAGIANGDTASIGARVRDLAEDIAAQLSERIRQLAVDAGTVSATAGAAFFSPAESSNLAREAGNSLRELRELAGLTIDDLATAIDLEDRTLLEAIEDGTAVVSFELLLRLSAILARHDPIPFLMRFTRTYNPDVWKRFEAVGAMRVPLQYEREREFLNIYRGDDRTRNLTDEGFQHVLEVTRSAFALALHYALAGQETEEK